MLTWLDRPTGRLSAGLQSGDSVTFFSSSLCSSSRRAGIVREASAARKPMFPTVELSLLSRSSSKSCGARATDYDRRAFVIASTDSQ